MHSSYRQALLWVFWLPLLVTSASLTTYFTRPIPPQPHSCNSNQIQSYWYKACTNYSIASKSVHCDVNSITGAATRGAAVRARHVTTVMDGVGTAVTENDPETETNDRDPRRQNAVIRPFRDMKIRQNTTISRRDTRIHPRPLPRNLPHSEAKKVREWEREKRLQRGLMMMISDD